VYHCLPMHEHALGICTNPTSDKGCSIWVMVGSAMATAPRQMMLYTCTVEALQVSLQLNNSSTCAKHRYTHPAEAHKSTALYSVYSSTGLHPLQYIQPFTHPLQYIQPFTTPLCTDFWFRQICRSQARANLFIYYIACSKCMLYLLLTPHDIHP
jgi:hypothetical protein